MNETMIQYFEWYLPNDGTLYKNLTSQAASLHKTGFTMVWMPPAFKGHVGKYDVGYGVYDLYDLGEFRQKGTIATKYGTKAQYLKAVSSLQKKDIKVVADVVLNHRMGADELEDVKAVTVNPGNRNEHIRDYHPVKVWTKYTFPGRNGKYSSFQWNWHHFTGTDFDQNTQKNEILEFESKSWSSNVSKENGNFDYVMGADVDFSSKEVISELYRWGEWYVKLSGINGFRLDAVKSIDSQFFEQWLSVMHRYGNHPDFSVGEYWSGNVWDLKDYLNQCRYCMKLMDVPLHYQLLQASQSNGTYDIRNLYTYTLTDTDPYYAVAFVDNHDTQPGQALESWVLDWFKPQAYASVLLNRCKVPCVFYGDYYGIPHSQKKPVYLLREMVWIRSHILSDNIVDLYDDDSQKACWMAFSIKHPVIVLYTIADWKERYIKEPKFAGMSLVDIADPSHTADFDEEGNARLTCPPGGMTIYISKTDYAKMQKDLRERKSIKSLLSKAL